MGGAVQSIARTFGLAGEELKPLANDSGISQQLEEQKKENERMRAQNEEQRREEAEKLIGKQAQEVGEVRKLADELIKQNLSSRQQPIKEEEPEVDFFENPQKAIQRTVDNHPDIQAARMATLEMKKAQIQQRLAQEHPDFGDIAKDQDFANWVKSSPVRIKLFEQADAGYDYDSANELLSTYKQLRTVKSKQVSDEGEVTRKQNLKAVGVVVTAALIVSVVLPVVDTVAAVATLAPTPEPMPMPDFAKFIAP